MTMLRAVAVGCEYVTQEADPADSWDRDDTAFALEDIHVSLSPEGAKQYGMYDRDFEVENIGPGDKVHVVYVQYTTGDTFGQQEGAITFMDIFPEADEKKAQVLATALAECKGWDLEVGGRNYYIPFNGYFESLEGVGVTPVIVRK